MSEYQYYEFRAVDRPLTRDEIAEVRQLSSRAEITPTRFMNVYNYGDFRGDPDRLIEKFYDAFLYEANWGTHRLMLRLPKGLVDPEAAEAYAVDNCVTIREHGDHTIFEFMSDAEENEWIQSSEAWLPALLPLRDDLANGDLRVLYLGWLSGVQAGFVEDDDEADDEAQDEELESDEPDGDEAEEDQVEPPVPPGLGQLSPALKTFAEFFRVDEDLIAVAAAASTTDVTTAPTAADLLLWITALPPVEKNALLLRVMQGGGLAVQGELLRRFRLEQAARRGSAVRSHASRRTAGQLLALADECRQKRQREEKRRAAEEQARKQREATAQRAKYLDSIAGREEELWRRIETLVEEKKATPYDEAASLVKDIRDLSVRSNQLAAFSTRVADLRVRHARKPAFLQRLDRIAMGS